MSNFFQFLRLKMNEIFSSIPLEPALSLKYLLLVAIFLIFVYRWSSYSTSASSSSTSSSSSLVPPPSPPKLPLIGNLHQLGSLAHRSLQTLAQRHGPDIMLLHLGSRPVVVISSAEAASQIFKTHDHIFSDRPKLIFFEKVLYDYKDVVSAPYGEYWRQVRSICVLNLLSSKMVRSFRAVRLEEVKLMMSNIEHSCSKASFSSSSPSSFNLSEMLLKLNNDIICRSAMGRKYNDHEEGRGRSFKELSIELTELFTQVNIGDYIPSLAWFTSLSGLDAKLTNLAKEFDGFLEMVVQEHIHRSNTKDDGSNNDNVENNDFVDVLLYVQKENAAGFPLDRVSIKAIILDMIAGGTDTTFTALDWTMSELLRHPRVMNKLQNEVRGIVGNKTDITEDDLIGMHYLKAVIKETFRLHPPFPLLVPRMSNQDVKINGYSIKANTQVVVNAWAIGRDPKSYTNPERYEPERFMNNAIDYKGHDFELIPFGAGRRGCPGIQLATAVVELVLANIVHKIDWALPDGIRGEDLDMSESTGAVAHRKYPLKVNATLSKL